jgi:hypothetical protein
MAFVNVLAFINPHPRDSLISFEEENHVYTIFQKERKEEREEREEREKDDRKYTSVTTWVHKHFSPFDSDKIIKNMMNSKNWREGHKYWGMTAEQIKEQWSANTAAQQGTELHANIEHFMQPLWETTINTHATLLENKTNQFKDDRLEWQYFLNFVSDFPYLKPYRTEWCVFNEDIQIAGSIDMIYENSDGTLSIYDWKRSKAITKINYYNKYSITSCICHLPDSNFWHYALQLNMYKFILESKYDKKIKELFLVRLHPDAEQGNYELIEIPIMEKEIDDLLKYERI